MTDDRVDFFANSLASPQDLLPKFKGSKIFREIEFSDQFQSTATGVTDRDKGPQEADYLKEPERR